MSKGINKVILIGNLGSEPEVRTTSTGNTVANLSLATNESWRDRNGQQQERTQWHKIVLFGRQAEIARDYLRTGSSVYLEGKLQHRKYTDKQGQDQYVTEVVGNQMQMLGGRSGIDQSAQQTQIKSEDRDISLPGESVGVKPPEWLDDELPF